MKVLLDTFPKKNTADEGKSALLSEGTKNESDEKREILLWSALKGQ